MSCEPGSLILSVAQASGTVMTLRGREKGWLPRGREVATAHAGPELIALRRRGTGAGGVDGGAAWCYGAFRWWGARCGGALGGDSAGEDGTEAARLMARLMARTRRGSSRLSAGAAGGTRRLLRAGERRCVPGACRAPQVRAGGCSARLVLYALSRAWEPRFLGGSLFCSQHPAAYRRAAHFSRRALGAARAPPRALATFASVPRRAWRLR